MQFTDTERTAVRALVSSAEWPVLKRILERKLSELNAVSTVGTLAGQMSVAEEVAGRIWAIKVLADFLRDVGVLALAPKKPETFE